LWGVWEGQKDSTTGEETVPQGQIGPKPKPRPDKKSGKGTQRGQRPDRIALTRGTPSPKLGHARRGEKMGQSRKIFEG